MTIAIFASGTGSNALKIITHCQQNPSISFIILSNKKDAPIVAKAQELNLPVRVFDRKEFYEQSSIVDYLQQFDTQLIVLAGFLWLVPASLLVAFPKRIINLHPALLPKFGGKGMYGMKVHEAVKAAGETQTGITIHYVNEKYDEGEVILQAICEVTDTDTPESIAKKVQALEHQHLPQVVENLVSSATINN